MPRFTRWTTLVLLAVCPGTLAAQRAPAPRFSDHTPLHRVQPLPLQAGVARDSAGFQGNVATVMLGSGVLAVMGLVAGGAAGFVTSGAFRTGCGDDMCGLLGVVVGATAGEVVGAGLGGYLGGGRQGNVWLDILAASAVGAVGWMPTVKRNDAWIVFPIAQVLAVTVVDRGVKPRWTRRDLPH